MLKYLIAASALVLALIQVSSAQSPPEPGDLRDPASQRMFLSSVAQWLSGEFGLPHTAELPKLSFISPAEMLRKRYRMIGADPKGSAYDIPAESNLAQTVAIYDDADATIYVLEDWTDRGAAGASVLVHEMVHHLQHVGNMRFSCGRARESAAYDAQERWLQLHGHSLRADFDIDPFTVLVNSTCLN